MCAPARAASARAGESLGRSLGSTQYIPRNSLPPQTGQPRNLLPRGSGSAAEELTSGVTTSPSPRSCSNHGNTRRGSKLIRSSSPESSRNRQPWPPVRSFRPSGVLWRSASGRPFNQVFGSSRRK